MQEISGRSRSEQITRKSTMRDTAKTYTNGDRDCLLYHGIKSLLRCDEAEVVSGIAHYVISQHASLRIGSAFMERTRETPVPAATALLGGLTRFLEIHPDDCRQDGAVWVARLNNERGVLEAMPSLLPELGWTELKFRWLPDKAGLSALARSLGTNWRSILKLARLLHRRKHFFKVMRVIDLIGYYTRYLDIFRNGRFRLAVMSSHSNPHGIAFNLAARKCGIPIVLLTHGMPVRPVAQLYYDLAVVHCEAARQVYLEEGCQMNRVLIHGRQQHYTPMPEGPLPERLSVGLFLCKEVNEQRVKFVVERMLNNHRVSRILVRPHPKNLWVGLGAWIESQNEPRLSLSASGSLLSDLLEMDIVLAGNSSVLVDAVTAGRPSGYLSDIDYGSPDLHQLVALGLIYPIDNDLCFDPDAMLHFYHRPDWPGVLRFFANVDEDEESVTRQVVTICRELACSHRD